MSFSILVLASLGGAISFLSTALGSFLSFGSFRTGRFARIKFSVDFALGLMLSAVAFSLVAPAAKESFTQPGLLQASLVAFALGGFLIFGVKYLIERSESQLALGGSSSQLVLAVALIVHNFPEGLASGASLAGLSLSAAVPILSSISLQNIPEGLLMVLCLKSMGWSQSHSFLGGLASGLVELVGGVMAGFALAWASSVLPLVLMVAGGAMFTSVVIELLQNKNIFQVLMKPEFAVGLMAIPILNMLMG